MCVCRRTHRTTLSVVDSAETTVIQEGRRHCHAERGEVRVRAEVTHKHTLAFYRCQQVQPGKKMDWLVSGSLLHLKNRQYPNNRWWPGTYGMLITGYVLYMHHDHSIKYSYIRSDCVLFSRKEIESWRGQVICPGSPHPGSIRIKT